MNSARPRRLPIDVAHELWATRFSTALALFCGGSVVRGEGYPRSDLDVVVLFETVTQPWRESFVFGGWPIEVFAHDVETLAFFAEQDAKQGRPALVQMIAEALSVPGPTAFSSGLQRWARSVLAEPPVPTAAGVSERRYAITDLIAELRDARPAVELRAIAGQLYPLVCNFVLSTRGAWLGWGKTLPGLVQRAAPEDHRSIEAAFERFYMTGEREGIIRVAEAILEPLGGELFDGYRSDAPASARIAGRLGPWGER